MALNDLLKKYIEKRELYDNWYYNLLMSNASIYAKLLFLKSHQ